MPYFSEELSTPTRFSFFQTKNFFLSQFIKNANVAKNFNRKIFLSFVIRFYKKKTELKIPLPKYSPFRLSTVEIHPITQKCLFVVKFYARRTYVLKFNYKFLSFDKFMVKFGLFGIYFSRLFKFSKSCFNYYNSGFKLKALISYLYTANARYHFSIFFILIASDYEQGIFLAIHILLK